MNPSSNKRHVIDTIFVICLMLLFLISALTVISIGANIYKKNVATTSENYAQRVSIAYITEKVRQSDVDGNVYVQKLFDQNVLVFEQTVNGNVYNTYIYSYDGYLRELFARADLDNFYPQTGQKILKLDSFDIEKTNDNLLKATVTEEDGSKETVFIAVHSK